MEQSQERGLVARRKRSFSGEETSNRTGRVSSDLRWLDGDFDGKIINVANNQVYNLASTIRTV